QRGENLAIGYFAQHQLDALDHKASTLLHLQRIAEGEREQAWRDLLGGGDARGNRCDEPVLNFSGGEKARLALALIAWRKPNLLLLDEPPNHLDLDMRLALTLALQEFEGAVLVVSHDRHLLKSTTDEFLLVADGRDRKSTRLNSSHVKISYAVFCLKTKTECTPASRCCTSFQLTHHATACAPSG